MSKGRLEDLHTKPLKPGERSQPSVQAHAWPSTPIAIFFDRAYEPQSKVLVEAMHRSARAALGGK